MSNYCQQFIYPHGIYDNYNNNYLDFSKESTQNASTQYFDSEGRYNRNCQCECHQRNICNCQCCSQNYCNLLEELNELRCNYKNVIDDLNRLKSDKISTDSYINELRLENKRMKFNNLNINVGEENEKLKYDNGRFNEMLEQIFCEILQPLSNKINVEEGKLKGGVDYYFDKNYDFYNILNLFKKFILEKDNRNYDNVYRNNIENERSENLDKNYNSKDYKNNLNKYNDPYIIQGIPINKPLTFGNNDPSSNRGQNSPLYNENNNKINYQESYMNSKYHLEKDPNSLMNSINSQGSNMNCFNYDNNPSFNYPQYMNNNQMNYYDPNSLMNSINSQNSYNNNKKDLNNSVNFDDPRNSYHKYSPNHNINNYMNNNNKKNKTQNQNNYNLSPNESNNLNNLNPNEQNKKIKAVIKDQPLDSFPNNIDYQKYGKPIDSLEQEIDNKEKRPKNSNNEKNGYFYPNNQIPKNPNFQKNNYINKNKNNNNDNELKKSNSFSNFNSNFPFNQTFKEEKQNKNINKNPKTEKIKNSLNYNPNKSQISNLSIPQKKKNIYNNERYENETPERKYNKIHSNEISTSYDKKQKKKKILIPIIPKKKISPNSYELSNNNINVENYNIIKEKEKNKTKNENQLFYNPSSYKPNIKKVNMLKKSLSSRKENQDNNNKYNYFPDGSCWACDLGCSVSSTGYSPMTYSPYKNGIKRRNITPVKPGVKYEEYLRHKKQVLRNDD